MAKVASRAYRRQPEIEDWIEDELRRERNAKRDSQASGNGNSFGCGAASGSVETLERLNAFLRFAEEGA